MRSESAVDGTEPTRVAIACQGGGSHTAFTAGFLKTVFREWDHDRYELVGLSGTSGGAFNALAAWYGLVTEDEHRAITLLDALWEDFAANDVVDWWTNEWIGGASRIESEGVPLPAISPYHVPSASLGKQRVKRILTRHIDFDDIPDLYEGDVPDLVVGAVNVNAGEFETFTNGDITAQTLLASAAVPNLFRAVEIDDHLHWDGLFTQNPPIHDLMTVSTERKPQELWIVQFKLIAGRDDDIENINVLVQTGLCHTDWRSLIDDWARP